MSAHENDDDSRNAGARRFCASASRGHACE